MVQLLSTCTENCQDRFGGFHRNGALLDDDLGLVRDVRNHPGDRLDETHIGGASRPDTKGLGRRVDADKDNIGASDGILNSRREEQVTATSGFDDLVQSGLIDRKVVGIPGVNSLLIEIDYLHPNIGTFRGNHRHGRSADIAGPDAANLQSKIGCW